MKPPEDTGAPAPESTNPPPEGGELDSLKRPFDPAKFKHEKDTLGRWKNLNAGRRKVAANTPAVSAPASPEPDKIEAQPAPAPSFDDIEKAAGEPTPEPGTPGAEQKQDATLSPEAGGNLLARALYKVTGTITGDHKAAVAKGDEHKAIAGTFGAYLGFRGLALVGGLALGATVTEGSAGTALVSQFAPTVTASGTYTGSVFLARGNMDWVRVRLVDAAGVNGVSVWVNLASLAVGSVQSPGSATAASGFAMPVASGFVRVAATANFVTPSGLLLQTRSAAADAAVSPLPGATYYAFGAQLEAGAFVTSYIPTTGAAATRAADVASITGAAFTSWFNQAAGTVVVSGRRFSGVSGLPRWLELSDGTAANSMFFGARSVAPIGEAYEVIAGGVSQAQIVIAPSAPAGGRVCLAGCYSAGGGFGLSRDGGAVSAASSGSVPALSRLDVGNRADGLRPLNGTIARLRYYRRRLPNATLSALTA